MRACTRHGLPHPALMRFVLKLLANLTDPHDGDVSDRVDQRADPAHPGRSLGMPYQSAVPTYGASLADRR